MGIVWQHTRLPLVGAAIFVGFGAIADAADICVGSGSQGGGATPVFNFTSFPTAALATTLNAAGAEPATAILPGTIAAILPQGAGHSGNGIWYTTVVNVAGGFRTDFTFQIPSLVNWTVCGLCFCVQNSNGTTNPDHPNPINAQADANCCDYGAFSPPVNPVGTVIGNSIAIKFDANPVSNQSFPAAGAPNSTGLYVNGGPFAGLFPANDMNPYGINLYTGNVMAVAIVYDHAGQLLTMVISDTVTGAQCRQVWSVNIPFACSSSTAYVGLLAAGAEEGSQGGGGTYNEAVNALTWSFSTGFNSRLATPTLSPAPGSYSGTQSVAISGPSGASIYYTTNGLMPTSASTLYTGTPISVSSNEVIQVVAIESGFTDSLVGGGAYQISTVNIINYPSGFATNNAMVLCGFAALSGSAIQLTSITGSQVANTSGSVGTAWFPVPVNIQSGWSAALQLAFTSAQASGMTFCIQNNPAPFTSNNNNATALWSGGPNVMGMCGSGLGYGGNTGSGGGSPGILNSVAVAFDLGNGVGVYTNGATPTGSQTASGLTFNGGTFNVTLSYTGTTLALTMQAVVGGVPTGPIFTHSWTVDIPGTVGANTAYVGFTASTNFNQVANQLVNSFTFEV